MRLVITGGLGHIGSGVLKKISSFYRVNKVLVIDNLLSNRFNVLFNITDDKKIKFNYLNRDILSLDLNKILKKNDIIIHLAAITNATESFKIRNKVFNNNFLSTKKIANACIKKNAKCIFFSSTSVYGSSKKIMLESDKKNLKPQSPYAECKIKEENYINKVFKNKKKGKMVILRLGTIFGVSEGIRFHTAVNKFCFQAATKNPLTIWKTAYNQKRPYLDLNDVIRSIKFIIERNLFDNDTYNLASQNLTIRQLISKIKKYKKIKINYVSSKIMNQLSFTVNCDKIKKKGFRFKGNLDQQIKDTLNLFRGINK